MTAERCTRYRDRDSDADPRGWREHLDRCPDCARQARLDAMLREGYRTLPRPRPSPSLDHRLEAALRQEAASRGAPRPRPRPAAGRWVQRLYWLAASSVSVALFGRALAAAPAPAGWAVAAAGGLLLGIVVLVAGRTLRTLPGLLILRSL